MRRHSEAFREAAERKRKQDEAPRLRDAVPTLLQLDLQVIEERANVPGHEVRHKRVIIIERAPALFEFACSDRECNDGGHDLSGLVLKELGAGIALFHGVHRCGGHTRDGECAYDLRFEAHATYRDGPRAPVNNPG